MLRIFTLLVIDNGFFETMCEVYTMKTMLAGQDFTFKEIASPVNSLTMYQLCQFQQEGLACKVIKPIDHLKVIASALLAPECPMTKWFIGYLAEVVAELVGQEGNDARVGGGKIVLLQNL